MNNDYWKSITGFKDIFEELESGKHRGRLLIVRGLPGSGKSTYVKNNYPGIFTLETDMFNVVNGQYHWTRDRSHVCINIIEHITFDLFKSPNSPDFALTGVFSRHSSFINHIKNAISYNYDVYIKTLTTDYGNIHNVPEDTLKVFKDNFVSEEKLKEIYTDDKSPKYQEFVHFDEMPKIDWRFNPELDKPDFNCSYNGE